MKSQLKGPTIPNFSTYTMVKKQCSTRDVGIQGVWEIGGLVYCQSLWIVTKLASLVYIYTGDERDHLHSQMQPSKSLHDTYIRFLQSPECGM